jgi:ribosomal protein L44E
MNRKQRRQTAAKAKKSKNKDFEEAIEVLSKMDNECKVCKTKFDRSNFKMLSEWMVVVEENEEKVKLYCPECWNKVKTSVEFLKKLQEETKEKD